MFDISAPRRCSTVVGGKRADSLALGDVILLAMWQGSFETVTVTGLMLCGDDVEVVASTGRGTVRQLSTSIGNVFHVVTES